MESVTDEKVLRSNVVIVDVEGTVTSISYVKDVLFPYATEKAAEFLAANWDVEGVQEAVEGMRQQAKKDVEDAVDGVVPIPEKDATKEDQIEGVSKNLKWLIAIDNKGMHMKKLSGLIWEQGYTKGDIKGHVYDDVQPSLEAWRALGKRIYIYSSGSVHAQKLLMKHSVHGDISGLFDGNFDTTVGQKNDAESYKNIIKQIECQADEALFLTDIFKEAEAAQSAGINVVLVVREGNAPLDENQKSIFSKITSLEELGLQTSSKRKQESSDIEDVPPTKLAKTEEENDKTDISKKQSVEDIAAAAVEDIATAAVEESEEAMEVDVCDDKKTKAEDDIKKTETEDIERKESNQKTDSSDKQEVPAIMETDKEFDDTDDRKEVVEPNKPIEIEKDESVMKVDDVIVEDCKESEKKDQEIVKNDKIQDVVIEKSVESKESDIVEEKVNVSDKIESVESKKSDIVEEKVNDSDKIESVESKKSDIVEEKVNDSDKIESVENKCATVENGSNESTKPHETAETIASDVIQKDKSEDEKNISEVEEKKTEDIEKVESPKDKIATDHESTSLNEVPEIEDKITVDEPIVEETEKSTSVDVESSEEKECVPEITKDSDIKDKCEESKSNPEKVDIPMDTDAEDKLNDILGEESSALEKECDDILSKVNEVTTKSLAVKAFIEKEIIDKESVLNDAMEVIADAVTLDDESSNNVAVTETPSEVRNDVPDTILPDTKNNDNDVKSDENMETNDISPVENNQTKTDKEVIADNEKTVEKEIKLSEKSDEPSTTANNSIEHKDNNKPESEEKESIEKNSEAVEESKTNGTVPVVELNGTAKEQNGTIHNSEKNDSQVEERLNGSNGDSKEETKSVEPVTEQVDLKSKKIATEVTPEQVAET